jgi:branched-chain amino acid aminotransferase
MSAVVNVNGRIASERDAVISVFDHGFLYGEGVYETLRTYDGTPFLFARHMIRLRRSARMISLDVPLTDDELLGRIGDTMAAADLEGHEAYIRVLVTRGVGELTYDLNATPTPSIVVIVKPQIDLPTDVYEQGVTVAIVSIVRNHPRSVDPMIKSNNLMNSALATQEAYRRGAFEAIMLNYRGELTEGAISNLFVVKSGAALTPPLESGLLPGITREFVFRVGKDAGIDVREEVLVAADLFGADEAFLTGTTREIVPIVTVDDKPIGSRKPGPITKALLAAFRRAVRDTRGG